MSNTTMTANKGLEMLGALLALLPANPWQRGGGVTAGELRDPGVYKIALEAVRMEIDDLRLQLANSKKNIKLAITEGYDRGWEAGYNAAYKWD